MMKKIFFCIILVLIISYGCGNAWEYTKPVSFLEGNKGLYEYRVIASNGKTVIAVREMDNPQNQITGVWSGVISQEMARKDYKLLEQKVIKTNNGGLKGNYLKFKKEYQTENYIYMIVIFETTERIYTLEFTTPESFAKEYVPQFEKSINSFGENKSIYRWHILLWEAIF